MEMRSGIIARAYRGLCRRPLSPPVTSGTGTSVDGRRSLRVVACLLTGLACLWVGYLLVWQRGPYSDDHATRRMTLDPVTGQYRFAVPRSPIRFLSCVAEMNLTGLLYDHELPVRVGLTLAVGLNTLLLALLVHRLTGSALMTLVTGWTALMPFYAAEAVLWVSAVPYVMGMFFALSFLHAACTALAEPRRATGWTVLAVLCAAAATLSGEQFALVVVLVPFLYLALAAQGKIAPRRAGIIPATVLMLAPLALSAGVVLFAYLGRTDSGLSMRRAGLLELNVSAILQRGALYLGRLSWMTASPHWGRRLTQEAFALGLDVLRSSPAGMILVGSGAGLAAVVAVTWRRSIADGVMPYRTGLFTVGVGGLWFMLTTLLPGILIRNQMLEYRMLYLPFAGLSVICGALAWLVAKSLGRPLVDKIAVLGAAGVLLASTVCMTGYARAFAARSSLDQRQIAAIVQAIPVQHLPSTLERASFEEPTECYTTLPSPPERVVFVPYENDEWLFGRQDTISRLLVGVLETHWSARGALEAAYKRVPIHVVTTTRWAPLHIEYAEGLRVGGRLLSPDITVLLTYRGGKAYAIESLTVQRDDNTTHRVTFPIAISLRYAGIETIDNVAVRQK